MKQPTLKEVKKHFKNALIVESPVGSFDGKIKIKSIRWYDKEKEKYIACDCDNSVGIITLWAYDTGFSKILTYKEKTFSITESQINNLKKDIKNGYHVNAIDYLEKLFSETVESEVKQLPKDFTGWCKCSGLGNEKWTGYFENGTFKYGIGALGEWFFNDGKNHNFKIDSQRIEATEQEVLEALKNEAVKRGFKEADIITDIYYSGAVTLNSNGFKLKTENELWLGDCVIFYNGVWAEKTITLSEAEQQLGKKIIV